MQDQRVTRNVIQIISRYSKWTETGIAKAFKKEGIYADRSGWAKFIDILLLSLAVGFCMAGIILFFAYNWAQMHKFVKLGLIQGLIIVAVGVVIFTKLQALVKQIILTGASVLVGVLFAVFGQIYQTGADAYDFFLGWTVFMAIWALVSNFAPLWLILQVLVNITLVLYNQQVGSWSDTTLYLAMFILNTAVVVFVQLLHRYYLVNLPAWYSKTIGLGAVICATCALVEGVFSHYGQAFYTAVTLTVLSYTGGIYYSLRKRSLYYLCIIPLSVIVVASAIIVEVTDVKSESTLVFIAAFIIGSVTLMVRELIKLNKKWHGG